MDPVRSPGVDPPSVVVLVLNWNDGQVIEPCLRSLQATSAPRVRLVVLDNGSTDGSADVAERLGVEVHRFGSNLGFCGAYNRGFREAVHGEDFVLVSNPDLSVPPDVIGRMMDTASADPTIGFVGPVQRHMDTKAIRSAGVRWRCGHLPENVMVPGEPLDTLEAAFLLARREVLEKVGGLDESFFINFEDVDWQFRARKLGYRSVLAKDVEILHKPPGDLRRSTGAYYSARNGCTITARYCGRGALLRLRARLFSEGLLGALLGRPRGRFILEGLRDFRRGVTGKRPSA